MGKRKRHDYYSSHSQPPINLDPNPTLSHHLVISSNSSSSRCSGGGWGSLHEDMLGLILDKVLSNSVYDYVRCATVCKSWFYSSAQYLRGRIMKKKQHQLPLFLILNVDDDSETHRIIRLHNIIISNNSISASSSSSISLLISVPEDCKRCYGSSQGWLIFAQEKTLALKLFNPFTGATIHLPPFQKQLQYDKIKKVVLSDDPSSNNFEVLSLQLGGRLALFTSKGGRWICDDDLGYYRVNADILYFKGKFHALIGEKLGSIEICNRDDEDDQHVTYIRLEPLKGVEEIKNIMGWGQSYLAESISGTLLYIQRFSSRAPHVPFMVYELEEKEDDQGIKRFTPLLGEGGEIGLADQTLFLGYNHSTCVRASDFPGCKPNSIYFTHYNRIEKTYNVSVYTIWDDEHVKLLYMHDDTPLLLPIWIEPRPNLNL